MSRYRQIDLSRVKTRPVGKRKSKVSPSDFARPYDPRKGSFHDFIDSIPRVLAARDLRRFAQDVADSRARGKPVIALIGAHVVKTGVSPLLIDLASRGVLTCIGMNSAAAIHDVETALWGKTSEDVEENLADGSFGMWRETGEFINGTLSRMAHGSDAGYGEALGIMLARAPNRRVSILASCYRLGIPVTVHAAIGADIVHQQPSMDGAATGEMSFRDFKVLCGAVKDLRGGGVVMNIGSAVIMPEVFLKAVSVARNLGYRVRGFTTANFDMIQHYRPRMNIVHRPTAGGGRGYLFTGHHEIMIPLVCAMIRKTLRPE